MAWEYPKTNWQDGETPTSSDANRWEGNSGFLYGTLFGGKNRLVEYLGSDVLDIYLPEPGDMGRSYFSRMGDFVFLTFHLRYTGPTSQNILLFTLPEEFRPNQFEIVLARWDWSWDLIEMRINPDGTAYVTGESDSLFSCNGFFHI